ncbi:uncharacterized protein LOC144009639 [Festucalex cinctus]
MTSGSLQIFLLAAVVVALVQCQPGKPTECCKKVSYKEITEEVYAYRVQRPQAPCLPAVIFYTADNFYCVAINAPWARQKAAAISNAAAAAARSLTTSPPSESSLLTILTSTSAAPSSSPPSSSTSSSPSTSPSSSSPSSSSFSPRLRPTTLH